ncbi:Structure-specific endonuclease subunit SLX4 [Fusarium austroafricanum]|uniref:Structure-specific endonuclease subunit SLX4 n=1 Tax=Fusarium austroafricanum TaxID=2364996 RepID=A0A8H4NJG2_9HYPO|nr:Structure-specific endonuclease subunit SLX4 [Fusarium austroafricanum]
MVSSDVFGTSPLGDTKCQPLHVNSSSPDLPPLRDILTKPSTQPPTVNGNRVTPFPANETHGFISARQLYPATYLPSAASGPSAAAGPAEDILDHGGFIAGNTVPPREQEDDIVVVKITGKSSRKPRQQKVSKPLVPKRATKAKPAKKKQSAGKATDEDPSPIEDNDNNDTEDKQAKPKASKPRKKRTGTMSNHFPPAEEPEVSEKPKKVDANEPLHLEQAAERRLDWTPPAQKTIINIDSDSSAFKKPGSSEANQHLPIFKDLVGGYSCLEEPNEPEFRSMVNTSDEDSSFLKKRKRIELLATGSTNPPAVAPEKSPTKKPPKKKKPRTITELATAAYRLPSQPDVEPPNASILDHLQTTNNGISSAADEQPKSTKGKGNSRRKTTKAPKKKAPPKPILLSPGAALAQVANQDFVFGTSSQLAREESPTVLRDLQAALKQSNQNDSIDFAIPIDSDAIEPREQRSKLWDAAARGAEGDLFDVEVINLAEDTTLLSEVDDPTNPFGYNLGGDDSVLCVESRVLIDHDPSIKPSDAMPSSDKSAPVVSGAGSPYFSDSDLSTSTNIHNSAPEQTEVSQLGLGTAQECESLPKLPPQPPRPNYEGFTDIRLAREIKKFGFKPIKRRSAMIALLDQCWQSKVGMGKADFHTSAKSPAAVSKSTKTTTSPVATSSPKRPRGRPRKNSISAPGPQEPPPSAQPPETPKRPRGRPRKDSSSSSPGIVSNKPKSASSSKQTAGSPRYKKAARKSIIEIPDSEDSGSDFASSPDTDIEQMFSSPPPLDMSLTTNDGTPLTATQTDQEVVLFEHITDAVTSAPRTTDPQEPSWHEKILLYDPIVLEDLAAWLNSGGLNRVGYDGEVNPNDVKKWCESKSICCLWRVNLRGKERKRF